VKGELVEYRLFFTEGEDSDSVNFALQHAAYAVGQDGGIAVGGTDQNFVAVGYGDFFEALDQLREEGVCDVFNDDAKKAAAAGDQGASVRVGEVVELLDGLPDALGQFLADDGRAVDGSRHCCDGDFGQCGYSPDIGCLVSALTTCFSSHEWNPKYI